MTYISIVAGKTAQYTYTTSQIIESVQRWLKDENKELFERFCLSSCISERSFVLPLEEIFQLEGFEQREEIFIKKGRELGATVLREILSSAELLPSELKALVFTSCSVPTIPSLDTILIHDCELPQDLVRVPVYQYGCAGGAAGLSLATTLANINGPTILLSVELCSLVYQGGNLSRGNLVGSSLFSDGASGVLLSKEKGQLKHIASQSYLIPESQHLMGYYIKDDGTHLRLDKELPSRLLIEAPTIINNFCKKNGVDTPDWWLFHPGGVKILEGLKTTLNLSEERAGFASAVLNKYGNMSSSSILFVLREFLESKRYKSGEKVILVGIGPGITVELLLFEVV